MGLNELKVELGKAMNEFYKAELSLESIRCEKIARANLRIEEELAAEIAKVNELKKALDDRKRAVEDETIRLVLTDGLWGFNHGQKIQRVKSVYQGIGLPRREEIETGFFEIATRESKFASNLASYSIPPLGQPIVRLAKKDGTPSLKFVRFRSFDGWKPIPEDQPTKKD